MFDSSINVEKLQLMNKLNIGIMALTIFTSGVETKAPLPDADTMSCAQTRSMTFSETKVVQAEADEQYETPVIIEEEANDEALQMTKSANIGETRIFEPPTQIQRELLDVGLLALTVSAPIPVYD